MTELYLPYVSIGTSTIGLIIIAYFLYGIIKDRHKLEPAFEPPAISDWRQTGKIDAMASADVMAAEDENLPAKFHLLVEETRQVADISGSPIGEVRWRLATRAEVKDIVRRHRLSANGIGRGIGLTAGVPSTFELDAQYQEQMSKYIRQENHVRNADIPSVTPGCSTT